MAPAPLQGKNLGKYRVLEPLGRGGMAQVYRAYHPQLDRYLAIKVLRSDLVEEEEFLARFQREARAVAALRHPNIVQIFDFDAQDEIYYMVMELLEGDTLKARLNAYRTRGETMPFGEAGQILTGVLSGLECAHTAGIIHRDIKPANIMLNRRGQAILTDFGIAQIIGGTRYTMSGAMMGTLHYMAPEQGLEGRCDARSDLYSLGIVFYEMVTGGPPFDAETPLAVLMKHLNDPLPLPRLFNPRLPEAFERVILKVLAKNPDDRYQSAAEMARAVQNALLEAHIANSDAQTAPKNPQEAQDVPVFSGEARQHIPDVLLASDDTEAGLNPPLTPAAPVPPQSAAKDNSTPLWGTRASFWGTSASPGAGWLDRFVNKWLNQPPYLTFLLSMAAFNLGAATIGVFTRDWGGFAFGWPFELYLVSMGLSLLMSARSLIWIFVPAGLIFGNGFIFAYYSLSGSWQQWSTLWPLEPLLVIAVIWLALRWSQRPEAARVLAHQLGRVMALTAFTLALLTIGFSLIAGIFR